MTLNFSLFTFHFSLCNNKAHFPYTLISATLISLQYLKIFSVWFHTAENREFRKPLMINALIFKAIFSLCKSTQITVQSGPNHTVIKC